MLYRGGAFILTATVSDTHQCTHIIATILQIEFPLEYPSHWVLHWKHKDAFLIHAAWLGHLGFLHDIPYSIPLVEVARRVVASLEAGPVWSSFLTPEVPNGPVVQALVIQNMVYLVWVEVCQLSLSMQSLVMILLTSWSLEEAATAGNLLAIELRCMTLKVGMHTY